MRSRTAIAAAWIVVASTVAVEAAGSADIPVPGGTVAMARALGIEPAPDRPRFLVELVRVLYDTREGRGAETDGKLALLTNYVDAVGRFQAALAAVQPGGAGIALATAAGKNDRDPLKEFLDLVGLKLREKNKALSVELTDNKQAAERVRHLADLGIDLAKLATQLNAGETVRIQIPIETVPVPLTSTLWADALFHRPVPASMLFATILSDRRAALLAHGLAALDDETLQYLSDNPTILFRLYEDSAASFAAFGEALRIRGGRVVPPGGSQGLPVWESVLDEKVTSPDRFVRAVFGTSQGRLALVYAALTHLDAPHVRFALGSWLPDPEARITQFKVLLAVSAARAEWDVTLRPFTRPIHDVTQLLTRVRVQLTGAPAPPAARLFWQRAFEADSIPDDPAERLRNLREDGVVDAGWLAENVCVQDPRARAVRLDQLSFGQRTFATASDAQLPDALVAVGSLPRFHMLILTLDRMGVRDPRVYAAAARQARQLTALDGRRAFVALGQFQGALALTARLIRVHSLAAPAGEALAASLAAVALHDDGAYHGGIARWIDRALAPALQWPSGADADLELVRALAGVPEAAAAPTKVSWEGRTYRVDLVTPEQNRLTRAREKMSAPPVHAALDMAHAVTKVSASPITVQDVRQTVVALRGIVLALPKGDKKPLVFPPGVEAPKNAIDIVNRTIVDLSRITQDKDLKNVTHAVEPLSGLSDDLLAQALMSLVYALDIGDPDGTTLLGGDPSRRHDFGLDARYAAARLRGAWAEPSDVSMAGAPRHVEGSLLGLDLGLSALALRRIDSGEVPPAPTLMSPDRGTFIKTAATISPYDLTDAGRDAIVAAMGRGRARVEALSTEAGRLRAEGASASLVDARLSRDRAEAGWNDLADQIRMDGWRRRAGRWALANDPALLPSFLSLAELVSVGEPAPDLPLDRWGMIGLATDGCLCTMAPQLGHVPVLAGRPQLGLLATQVADINLRIAERLGGLGLPASLARGVLAAAVQDFVDHARPIHPSDWLTMVRTAQAIPDDRVDDYVAALTADGPLVPDRSTAAAIAGPARSLDRAGWDGLKTVPYTSVVWRLR
jgi:hypothetical protein